MKKPSLEEVKEYFKDAKIVRCIYVDNIFDITEEAEDIRFDFGEYWIKADRNDVNLWDKSKGYAKILTYKNNDMKITKGQIKVLHEFGNEITRETLKDLFPDLFKIDYNEPILSLNDLLPVWGTDDDIEFYKRSPMFKSFERLAEDKLKSK
jgi:hypothetical protein